MKYLAEKDIFYFTSLQSINKMHIFQRKQILCSAENLVKKIKILRTVTLNKAKIISCTIYFNLIKIGYIILKASKKH